jgi:hypothetical protein
MKTIIILVIIASAITFISCKFSNSKTNKTVEKSNDISFLFKTNSFSYIFFRNDCRNEIKDLLKDLKYTVYKTKNLKCDLYAINSYLNESNSSQNIVNKGLFFNSNFTVLIDPEMVVSTYEEQLIDFAKKNNTTIISVIWERYSQAKIMVVISPVGLVSKTISVPGQDIPDNFKPNHNVLNGVDEQSLLEALTTLDVPYKNILSGVLDVELLKLYE